MLAVNNRFAHLLDGFGGGFVNGWEAEQLRVEAYTTSDAHVIRAEVPGVSKENVEIEYKNGILEICVEKKKFKTDKTDNYSIQEVNYGKVKRRFQMPDHVDGENISADLKDGILTINIPIEPEKRTKKIEVKSLP